MTEKANVIVIESDEQRKAFVSANKPANSFALKRPVPSFASSSIWKKTRKN